MLRYIVPIVTRRYQIRGRTARAIAESFEVAIDAGRIAPGAQLPTIRALAGELEVSPTTVNGAYALLRAHGRITGNRRGGSVALGRPVFQSVRVAPPPVAARDLSVANPDPVFLPSPAAALRDAATRPPLLYGSRDDARLLDAARRWFARDGVKADELAVVGGAMDGIERALQAHLAPGDAIALEDPTYPPYRELARAMQLRVIPVAMDDRGALPDALAAAVRARARAFICIPRGQNPTGCALDRPRARALRAVLDGAPDVLAIEDDYLSDIAGAPLATIGGRGRWWTVRSVAKLFGPDLRLGIAAGDPLTVARVRDRQRIGVGWVSHIVQDVVASFFADPATERLHHAASRAYAERRTALIQACAARGFRATGASGFTVWIAVPEEAATVAGLLVRGWAVDAGERYRFGGTPAIRVTITTLLPAEAQRFADDLAAVAGDDEPPRP